MKTEFRNKITAGMNTSFRHKAAKVSWINGLLLGLLLLAGFGGHVKGEGLLEMVILMLMIMGVLLGTAALTGLRKYGAKGLLVAALTGIIVNGILIYFFAVDFRSKPVMARGPAAVVPATKPAK